MKNKALISLSFLVLFGVSACSTSDPKPNLTAKKTSKSTSDNSSASMRPSSGKVSAYDKIAYQKEQERLAYNRVWQQQEQLKKNKGLVNKNKALARNNWQRQQANLLNQERNRLAKQKSTQRANAQRHKQKLAQQRKHQQFTQEQNQLAREYAIQQMQLQKQRQAQLASAKRQKQQNQQRQYQLQAARQLRQQTQVQAPPLLAQAPRQSSYQPLMMQAPRQIRQQRSIQAPRQPIQQPIMQVPRQLTQQPIMQAPRQVSQNNQYRAMLQQRNRNTQRVSPPGGITNLSRAEMRSIGDKIFRNESGGDIDKLVHWNVGEDFASMGIGHFTWYPSGRRNRYGNTFPGLLDHLQANGVQLPAWVQRARHSGAPWRTKNELKKAKNSRQIREFQNLLYETRHIQAGYIMDRAKRAMPRLVKKSPPHLRGLVAQNLNAVANTPGGWYPLIDYVNFKGEGLSRNGGYKGQNWGLLQVLENMRPSQPGPMALNNFADSAIQILERRVRNSNPSRGESRWMRGWTVRCNTYRQPMAI